MPDWDYSDGLDLRELPAMNASELNFDELCQTFGYEPKRRPLDAKETAELLGISTDTLEGYRYRGGGPRYFSPNASRRIWYAEGDLLLWLMAGARYSTSDEPLAA
jgi:hypothetical protein